MFVFSWNFQFTDWNKEKAQGTFYFLFQIMDSKMTNFLEVAGA